MVTQGPPGEGMVAPVSLGRARPWGLGVCLLQPWTTYSTHAFASLSLVIPAVTCLGSMLHKFCLHRARDLARVSVRIRGSASLPIEELGSSWAYGVHCMLNLKIQDSEGDGLGHGCVCL